MIVELIITFEEDLFFMPYFHPYHVTKLWN